MENTDRILNSRFCSHTLDCLNHYLTCLLVCIEFRLVHNLVDITGCSSFGLIFHRLHQTRLCFFSTQSRYFLKFFTLLQLHLLQLFCFYRKEFLLIIDALLLIVKFILLTSQLLLTLIQRYFALLQLVLTLLDVLITLLNLLLKFTLFIEELLFYFKQFLFFDDLRLLFCSIDHLLIFPFQDITEN